MAEKPTSIAIVMDGNRRYARSVGLSNFEGHRQGVAKIKDVTRWAKDAGITNIIIYGFSTENWGRASEEVAYLMDLFAHTFGGPDLEEVIQEGFRVRVIGERERLPLSLQKIITAAETRTKDLLKGTLTVGISYGGRAEILAAVNTLLAEKVASVDEEGFRKVMWTAGIPDPDLIIRTGGDNRLSNFLPWQSIYSELFFTNTYWPAFTHEEFNAILDAYAKRERRNGK